MDDYNKILDTLSVQFVTINSLVTSQTIKIETLYDTQSKLLFSFNGNISFKDGKEVTKVEKGETLFVPGRQDTFLTLGKGSAILVNNDSLDTKKDEYLDNYTLNSKIEKEDSAAFMLMTFDTKAFGSVNFFTALGIPTFVLNSEEIAKIVLEIYGEVSIQRVGNIRSATILAEKLAVEVFRYIIEKSLFVEQLATNMNYFKDPRLIKVFRFIKENLADDLSNKNLAEIADVSEDYVGQYFKMLTSINPQDYIEYQRMERAVDLLRSSNKSIKNIGFEVGYKDTAYFCRRFKMMFGIPAGKMRRRESLLGV